MKVGIFDHVEFAAHGPIGDGRDMALEPDMGGELDHERARSGETMVLPVGSYFSERHGESLFER